jgi:two-component system chemotaxis sensor kinase CheA
VIKSLESNYRRVEGVAGATILGNGMVALILDVDGIHAMSHKGRRPAADIASMSAAELSL